MTHIFLNAFLSAFIAFFIIYTQAWHGKLSTDHEFNSPQKLHKRIVPRIGGLAIFMALSLSWAILAWYNKEINPIWSGVLLAGLPVFIAGLAEDMCKKISPLMRLLASFLSAGWAIYSLGAVVQKTGLPWVDHILSVLPIAYLFTMFAVAGVINAINIIDGLNGLVPMVVMVMFTSIAYIAWRLGDATIMLFALACLGAMLGFFLWNFPNGLIFLGDGGAYFLGFILAELSILLVVRHPEVSPWYAILMLIYPIFETLFSIYRKKFLRGTSPAMPDGLHLHMLVYKRLMRFTLGRNTRRAHMYWVHRNAFSSPYLWILNTLAVIPATIFWRNTLVLQGFCVLFILSYVWLYMRIIRFRTPKKLVMGKSRHKSIRKIGHS